ncbi:MAG: ComEA family DNA-binding protein [Porticoccaceae bacterium]
MKITKSLFSLLCVLAVLGTASMPVTAETTAKAAANVATAVAKESGASAININTASADEIATALDGIGAKKADEIVRYREANGPFKDKQDILKIKGIGEATLKKNESMIAL